MAELSLSQFLVLGLSVDGATRRVSKDVTAMGAWTPLDPGLIHGRVKYLIAKMIRVTRTSVFSAKYPILDFRESGLSSLRHQGLKKQIRDVKRVFASFSFRIGQISSPVAVTDRKAPLDQVDISPAQSQQFTQS